MSKTFTTNAMGVSGVSGLGDFGSGVTVGALPSSLPEQTGAFPMPLDDAAPDETYLTFRFGTIVDDGAASPADAVFDPYSRVHGEPFRGSLILTDGMTMNREFDGDRCVDLEIESPSGAPTATQAGGSLTGDYYYKYRYKCSKTGKVSGFSPLSAVQALSSEKATVTVTGSDDPQVDVVEIFRNINGFTNLYYYVAEVANPATTGTYEDDNADDTISDNITDQLVRGKTYLEGRMGPLLRSFENYGFMWYYGVLRMKKMSAGVVDVTNGSSEVVMGTNCRVRNCRLGQKFVVDADTTEYTIIKVDAGTNKFYVSPVIVRATGTGLTYYIEDNRDGRVVHISEAGAFGSIPLYNEFTFGDDTGDDLQLIFALNGQTYAITRQRIYRVEGDRTLEPWMYMSATVVVEEGCAGPYAATVVPGLGLVYAEPRYGIRVFDGSRTSYLGRNPAKSIIHSEWDRFRYNRRSDIEVWHDTRYNHVVVSYARDHESSPTSQLVYDLGTQEWVGPWLRRVSRFGYLETYDGERKTCFGSDLGGLYQDHYGTRDGLATGTLSGTVDSVSNHNVITDSSAAFTTDGEGLYGCPVEFVDGSSQSYLGWIVANTGTTFTILGQEIDPQADWTYTIGIIPWAVKTGYIGAQYLGQNSALNSIRFRLDRGASGSVACAVGTEGGTLSAAQSGDETVSGKVYGRFRVEKRGTVFQFQMYGSTESEIPKITGVELITDVRQGERSDAD